jgi:preprotein translocase subunit YajC
MPQPTQVNPVINLLPLFFIFIIFYFLLIRPQKTKEKEHQKMLNNLNKNDEVVTSGGIHGTIVNIKERTLVLRVDENVKIEIEKGCVAYVKKTQSEVPQKV